MDDFVREYYGEILEQSSDLKTDACCTIESEPAYVKAALAKVHDEVSRRYYGCGLVLPELLDGCRVLDLGCGSGRDCYLLAQLVGEHGSVVGVDMTEAQLEVAERYREHHAQVFGHAQSNVELVLGDIERLEDLGLAPASFDVIVSNCVINLARDKAAVLAGAWQLLKPGGELYFADVYADRRVPEALRENPVLRGECLGGALYWNDFLELAKHAGFPDPRLVTGRPIDVTDPELERAVGDVGFASATYRLFKLPALEPTHEDYGQTARYLGTIPHCESSFRLDEHNELGAGETALVSGNTFEMLAATRFRGHFELEGDRSVHRGAFDGHAAAMPFTTTAAPAGSSCC